MSITTLKKRLTLGRPLLPSEHESNFADIEAFVNALEGIIGTSLNPDGTLKDGAVSGAAKVADSILTLAKLAITTDASMPTAPSVRQSIFLSAKNLCAP